MSAAAAFDEVASWIALPGTSEHQAGIAVDFNMIEERFENTPEFRWLQGNAHKFGFILRYASDTRDVTGIRYEPWHYTFVGMSYATKIRDSGLPLETYLDTCRNDTEVAAAFRRMFVD
jgi:D-alanyl-D-alanine carboxypeptidase